MLSQNTLANPFDLPQASELSRTLFDLGDCFGNLCRLPLENALQLFQSSRAPSHTDHRQFAQQLDTNIPFAISREWKNHVLHYQVSLHTETSQPLHQHLTSRSLSSIPAQSKSATKEWLYFASPLNHLTQLDWQLLSPEALKLRRLQHLAWWLQKQLQDGSLLGDLLLTPLEDLPLGDGLNLSPAHSFARVGKQSLPNQQRLPALNFAIFRQGRLTEGYGLSPQALFNAQDQLQQLSSDPTIAETEQPLLVLNQQQCLKILQQLQQSFC